MCAAAFDRDDEFFALAGVSKKIKIFELSGVLQGNSGGASLHHHHHGLDMLHYPVLEINSQVRLSSVCWNSYLKVRGKGEEGEE